MKSTLRLASQLALLGMMLGCATAATDKVAGEPHTLPSPSTSTSHTDETKAVSIVGVLTRKGPDMDSWWALTGDDGVLWKLEPANAEQVTLFRRWQNSRTRVEGITAGFMLAFPILKVEQIELVH
jgi:hypothetical protein